MKTLACILLGALSLVTLPALAADSDKDAQVRAQLAAKLPGATPDDFQASPIKGMYEFSVSGMMGYISADGRYVINGDLYDITSGTNVTEQRRTDMRVKALASLKEEDMIVFAPATPARHTITVFTDVDCGYCQKLHSEIAELNKLGIKVRYLAYPRSGPGTDSWAKADAVWCSKDRKDALTRAKRGEEVKVGKCGATPVARQFELGDAVGVRGTPAILTDKGDYIGGYLPPKKLLASLEEARQPVAEAR